MCQWKGKQFDGTQASCYNCGEIGHRSFESTKSPKAQTNEFQRPHNNYNNNAAPLKQSDAAAALGNRFNVELRDPGELPSIISMLVRAG